jgi:hypothetical protein
MRRLRTLAGACVLALSLATAAAYAATVSGKVIHSNGSPVKGMTVTLSNARGRTAPVKTNSEGSFQFNKIPAGKYFLEIWVDPTNPQSSPATVSEPRTELETVTVR